MEMAFNLLLLIFLLSMNELSFVHGDNGDETILWKMKSWGEETKRDYLPHLKTARQFIAVTILSNIILNDKDNFKKEQLQVGCPMEPITINTYECRTSAVIFNEDLPENDQRLVKINNAKDFQNRMIRSGNKGNKREPNWHGEVILIHGGILDKLISNFWDDLGGDETVHCEVYLYSYNIPCALIMNTPYSCSQEIMLYNKETQNDKTLCKITVVGYTHVYNLFKSKTNEEEAKAWLRAGVRDLILIKKNVRTKNVPIRNDEPVDGKRPRKERRKKRQASSESNLNDDDMIFQDLVYQCLSNTPLPLCCLSDPTDNMRQQKILSFFVNKMSHYCTHNSTERGSITSHSLPDLKRCFSSWLQDNVGSDCRTCSDGSLQSAWHQQYLVAFCIDGIMEWTKTFGRPSNGWDLTNPAWVPWNGPWNNMYLESVRSFQNRRNLFCENRMLDIGSMCTKMTTKTNKRQSMKNLLIGTYLWP